MIYITGDMYRAFYRLKDIDKNNMLIILGDVEINYCLDDENKRLKERLNSYNIKLLCFKVITKRDHKIYLRIKKLICLVEKFLDKIEESINYDKWYC